MSVLVPVDGRTAPQKTKLSATTATTIYTAADKTAKLLWVRMVNTHATDACDVTVTIVTSGGTTYTWLPATEIAAKASRTEDFDGFRFDEGDMLKVTAEIADQIEVFASVALTAGRAAA